VTSIVAGRFAGQHATGTVNYQQRSGRAGRKGQRFLAVLTYCRAQTHDRIHFDHPQEMTGGDRSHRRWQWAQTSEFSLTGWLPKRS